MKNIIRQLLDLALNYFSYNLYYVKLKCFIMKIIWIKIVDVIVKNVLPVVVNILVDLLETKVENAKKKVELV